MRLDMKRETEIAKRKGLARKTVLATLWLLFCFVVAYFLIDWLIETEVITFNLIYSRLLVPKSINNTLIRLGLMTIVVFIMQFFVLLGYAFSSPTGRTRPGTPTSQSRDPDPHDSKYDYR